MSGAVVFVVKGYPRLSETFIAQEIMALEQRGLDIRIASIRRPTDAERHPIHDDIKAPVTYLPEFPALEPLRVFRAWKRLRSRAGFRADFRAAWGQWLSDLRRGPSPARARSFAQALVLADEAGPGVSRLHAHFLHTPASVARYAAMMLDIPWSCSAHARDIWTTPAWEKTEKLKTADWLVTCTAHGQRHLNALAALADRPDAVELVYHGLDLGRFPAPDRGVSQPDGGSEKDPVVILSVGRAVEKKGYGTLLGALGRIPEDLHWRFVHIGGGPLRGGLQRRARALGIGGRITWMGACAQETVLEHYRAADLFVLASRIAPDGDRDGLPNVLMEAQSQGLACVSTALSAIPELIVDGETGVLVPPGDEESLAAAVAELIADPDLRARLGAGGHRRVRERFSHDRDLDRLARKFGLRAPMVRECA
ncbi:MAG: colanic acid biosynthesis glycosyltransferase WcaL [Rhodospirillaceae bacterium]|mgnify:FL=1|nr:colanic acid biosynthesis glycosyltransferase WcaL [Rhodospirillaceae bacterium]